MRQGRLQSLPTDDVAAQTLSFLSRIFLANFDRTEFSLRRERISLALPIASEPFCLTAALACQGTRAQEYLQVPHEVLPVVCEKRRY